MINRLTRLISALAAGVCWYLIFPARTVLAASKELNLDISEPIVAPMPSMFTLVLKLVVSLVIIVGLTFLVMRLLRKNMKVLSRGVNINVLDQYAFSLNKAVYITQIADKVYVLGVTDHNINLITEITDRTLISELITRAKEREMEPIIPPSILERILPGLFRQPSSGQKPFNTHVQQQIKKLQSMVDNLGVNSREDDRNE